MHEFKVWAPLAKRVAVTTGAETLEMNGPGEAGWWSVAVESARHGSGYGFLLDEDPTPYPDPRSLWQPDGVHALSRVYDQRSYEWQDARWQAPPFASAVVYEMHVGTFTRQGTFDGAISRLDYLHELGITHIELMPVAAWAGDRGWGYDGVALYAVTESYGGPEALKRFVDACHERGLAVLLDVVYNHFGPVGNYTAKFGPYLTDVHRTPWGQAVNFEGPYSDVVRRFFIDNALMWLRDFHLDGLRLDAVHEMVDRSAVHFLEQLSVEVELLGTTLGRRFVLVAESDLNDPKIVRPREARGYGMDAQWSDDFHHALFTLLHVEEHEGGYFSDFGSFERLAKALTRVFVYDGEYSRYRKRRHGRPVDDLSAHHFVGFIQNHDQVGNRATGERLEHIVGMAKARVAIGLVLTAPFIPMLFQGEEYAAATPFLYFADHEDPEMARMVSEGRRREFAAFGFDGAEVPDPEARSTFEHSRLDWDELGEPQHAAMLGWIRELIRLRRHSPSLNDGDLGHLSVRYDEAGRWLVMRRGEVEVIANFGEQAVELESPEGMQLLLGSCEGIFVHAGSVAVPPNSLAIFSRESM